MLNTRPASFSQANQFMLQTYYLVDKVDALLLYI